MKGPGTLARDPGYADRGYAVVRGLLGPELVEHLVGYTQVLRDSGGMDVDEQVPGSLRRYGAPGFDALLAACAPDVSVVTGFDLRPTYSFVRLYLQGQELAPHRDRPECEHSVSIHLGSSPTTSWPLQLRDGTADPIAADLDPGDAFIYRGDRAMHWREPLEAEWYLQVFLHYVDATGPFAHRVLDGREQLGVPRGSAS